MHSITLQPLSTKCIIEQMPVKAHVVRSTRLAYTKDIFVWTIMQKNLSAGIAKWRHNAFAQHINCTKKFKVHSKNNTYSIIVLKKRCCFGLVALMGVTTIINYF